MRFISSRGRKKSCIQTLAILALCSVAWVGVVEAQGITPGKWVGGNPSSEDPYFICLNVSDDGQRLTAVGTQCTCDQGTNRNALDIQWQGGTTPGGGRCNQYSYRRADQGDVQIASDGTFVHTFKNFRVNTTVTGKFDPTQGTVSGTAHTINPWVDCKVEWSATPTNPTEPTTPSQRENVEAFVTRFYRFCLNRSPEAAGLKDWTDKLISQTLVGADVAEGFIYSQEFINRRTTDEEYLNILYKAFFDRGPDTVGWNTWLPELKSGGRGRDYVLDGFLGSQEFIKLSQRFGIIPM